MASDKTPENARWYSGTVQHEGFPLYLRFPEKQDFDLLQNKYPRLLIVTHSLAKVTSAGVPEAEYNDSLAEFDHELVSAFYPSSSGITMLVETFGGKRNYYIYVAPDSPVEEIKQRISTAYPQHDLVWTIRDDNGWRFIQRYSDDYNFYK